MGMFTDALKEIKTTVTRLFLFEQILNAVLIFLAAYMASSILGLGIILPFLPALAYLGYATYKETKLKPNKIVEKKYQELKEKLSTAAEYAATDNPVVNELKTDVLKNLRKVEESSFISERRIYIKSIISIALCFIILLLSPVSLNFFSAKLPNFFKGGINEAQDITGNFRLSNSNAKKKADTLIPLQKSKQDIYGQPTVAKIGKEELEVIFRPAGTELSTSNVKPPEELQFEEQYPDEVASVAAESMEERIPKEQQELVRRYFKAVAQSGG